MKKINLLELVNINKEEALKISKRNVGTKIEVNTYFFLYRTGGDVQSTKAEAIKEKKLDEDLLADVTNYLIENNPEELESAFGDQKKKERLRSIINTYISRKKTLNSKGFTLNELSFELVNAIAGLDK